jgi:hypothetical protein
MARARFSIGIDLGTTNSALAFVPLFGEAKPEILLVPQWETQASSVEAPTLPSFLCLPEEALAAPLRDRSAGAGEWVVGRLARRRAGETPGRVIPKPMLLAHPASCRINGLREPYAWGERDVRPSPSLLRGHHLTTSSGRGLVVGWLLRGCRERKRPVRLGKPRPTTTNWLS